MKIMNEIVEIAGKVGRYSAVVGQYRQSYLHPSTFTVRPS